jgi:hypothetical protein
MSEEWLDPLIDCVLHGADPEDAIAGLAIHDAKEKWYSSALVMLLRARKESDNDPGQLLKFLLRLGYPLEDVLHVAMLFEAVLTALMIGRAVGSVLGDSGMTEGDIQEGAQQLICGVEAFLQSQ